MRNFFVSDRCTYAILILLLKCISSVLEGGDQMRNCSDVGVSTPDLVDFPLSINGSAVLCFS